MRTLLNPLALISAKVAGTTGGLFHEPSVGTASSVLPRFHPGFRAAKAADAVIGVKVPVQEPVAVAEAELDDTDEDDIDVIEDTDELLVLVDRVVDAELDLLVALELDVPGMHWEYPA